jgi:hypothetical protein
MGETVSFKEKLRSLNFSKGKRGTSKKVPVLDDRDGSVGGYQTEHWDDRQDAEVILKPVTVEVKEGRA